KTMQSCKRQRDARNLCLRNAKTMRPLGAKADSFSVNYGEKALILINGMKMAIRTQRMKTKCFTLATAMAIVSVGLCAQAQDATTSQTAQSSPPSRSSAYTGDYVGHFGVGAAIGGPIGVTAKYWLTDMLAADASVGWSPNSHATWEIHADVLVNDFDLL